MTATKIRPLFHEPRNRMPAVFEQDHKTYDNENDLAEAKLYVWIDDLSCTVPYKEIIIDIYCNAPENLVMWTTSQKGGSGGSGGSRGSGGSGIYGGSPHALRIHSTVDVFRKVA